MYKSIFNIITCLLIIAVFSFENLYPQDIEEGVYRIAAISTEGNQFYDSKTIISNSGLIVGSEITLPSDETRDAIMRLWNLKLFSDIEIYIDKKIGKDAYLVIKVKELPRLDKIKITGNEDISKNDIEEKISISPGQVITPQILKDIEYNIKNLYLEEGYPFTEVNVDMIVNTYNEAQMRIKINEGNKLTVNKILFEGNEKISSDKLADAMETSQLKWWKFWDNARFEKNVYEADKDLIIDYYKEKGFKDAQFIEDEFIYSDDKDEIDIKMKIYEGKRYKINSISFTGNYLYPDSVILEHLAFKKGQVYNLKRFQQNLRGNEEQTDVASLYLNNGYLGFSATVEEKPVGENLLDITIHISENQQYRIGKIAIQGNTKTQDKVIRRELYTIPAQYFNRANLIRSLRQLSTLNYFNPETLSYDFVQKNDSTVDLIYVIEEKSSDQFNASVGWSQTFGISGSIGLVFNNFDILDPISGGAGQILSFQWDFGQSGTFRTFSLGFTEPWFLNTPTLIGLNLYDSKQNYTYSIRETGATLNFGRRFRWPDDYFRGDWFLKFQRTEVIDGGGIYTPGVRSQLSIGQVISRSSTDNPIFPTLGSKVTITSELAGANLVGSVNFFKQSFQAEAYRRLESSGSVVLYSNFLFEGITSLADDNYIPPNEFLFMGGSGLAYNTVALRGYDDRVVGPLNSFGNPTGGRVLLKYGLELRYSLSLDPIPIYLLAFGEAGNVWAQFNSLNPFDLRRSVGLGIRLILPAVGLVGFDLGYGFDRKIVDGQDPKLIFHIQFGRGF